MPRLAEVSTIRLQADVSALVTAVVEVATPAAAASVLTGISPAAAESCSYPCTPLDKIIEALPPNLRNIILPPLYAAAFVIGLVLAPVLLVTSAVFGWPYSLRPAASTSTPQRSPAPAGAAAVADDPISTDSEPGTSSAVPGDTAGAEGNIAVRTPAGSDDTRPRVTARGTVRTKPNTIQSPASPEATEQTVSATGDIAPATDRPAHSAGRRSAAASTDSASAPAAAAARATKRSAR